jgi:hypothetical protein
MEKKNKKKYWLNPESNPSVARYKENTEKIRSILHISIRVFFVSVSLLAKGRRTYRYRVATYFETVEGTPFLFVSSFYLPTYLQSYVAHTYRYVLNSDEGLPERAQVY